MLQKFSEEWGQKNILKTRLVSCDFDRGNYHWAYYQVETFFKKVTEDQILNGFRQNNRNFGNLSFTCFWFTLSETTYFLLAQPLNFYFVLGGNFNTA